MKKMLIFLLLPLVFLTGCSSQKMGSKIIKPFNPVNSTSSSTASSTTASSSKIKVDDDKKLEPSPKKTTLAPVIKSYVTPTSTTIIMNLPNDYKGQVVTTYDGDKFNTYTTSSPMTAQDVETIKTNIAAQEKAMQDFFDNQQKMFDQMWTNFGITQ